MSFIPITPSKFANRIVLGYPDRAINSCKDRNTLESYFEVLCHGTRPNASGETFAYVLDDSTMQGSTIDAPLLAAIIYSHRAYHGQPIRLLMCWAGYGENSLAQQIADLLQTSVVACDRPIDTDYFLPDIPEGRWLFFWPRPTYDD
ncbi:MAG: hypothetical protein HXY39_19140 [Chloroflexi bacterium]|nr:hypothetical protein [Chloroflexota bacterium]